MNRPTIHFEVVANVVLEPLIQEVDEVEVVGVFYFTPTHPLHKKIYLDFYIENHHDEKNHKLLQ